MSGWALAAAAMLAGLVVLLVAGGRTLAFRGMAWLAGRGRPAIRWVDDATLAAELLSASPPVLLDVREAAEFEVSHLPGARHLPPGELPSDILTLPRTTPIVTYCAMGVRSARTARSLMRAGFGDVRNLEGSIFRWANAGRPLVNAAGDAGTVHPVGALWGLALLPERRAPLP